MTQQLLPKDTAKVELQVIAGKFAAAGGWTELPVSGPGIAYTRPARTTKSGKKQHNTFWKKVGDSIGRMPKACL